MANQCILSIMNVRYSVLVSILLIHPLLTQAQHNNPETGAPTQTMHFSTAGDAIDAHDGEIAYFNGVYYLYGTSYDCGFEWGNKQAPFCGFKSYSSTDLVNWTDRGPLFDAKSDVWQMRCNGSTYGCFRPHVIYNRKTKRYVLWINVYDNVSGYRVFTSANPTGPFAEQAQPKLGVNNDAPSAGLNNGDHDTFVDDDGTAYLAYTDWRSKGAIVIEQLSKDYLTGTGKLVKNITSGQTEAPALFKRNGTYYLLYSDPNCGYCSGTGTSYKTAPSPLGPWSEGKKISDNSCGGQPSFVSTFALATGNVYLYGSDLWNNGAKNEALANYFWAPLSFNADGSIKPIDCSNQLPVASGTSGDHAETNGETYFRQCDIRSGTAHAQAFQANRGGRLDTLRFNAFTTTHQDTGLQISIYEAGADAGPQGQPLFTTLIPSGQIGWSPRQISIAPNIVLRKNSVYCFVLSSEVNNGCYGILYASTGDQPFYTQLNGSGWKREEGKQMKYSLVFSH
jgi:hypothetical protein